MNPIYLGYKMSPHNHNTSAEYAENTVTKPVNNAMINCPDGGDVCQYLSFNYCTIIMEVVLLNIPLVSFNTGTTLATTSN